jgi:hypothetical protein
LSRWVLERSRDREDLQARGDLNRNNTYVIVAYDNDYYPGIIINICQEDTVRFQVKVMEKSRLFGCKWPKKDDISWYQFDDINKIISKPEINKRGQFIVPEMDKYV